MRGRHCVLCVWRSRGEVCRDADVRFSSSSSCATRSLHRERMTRACRSIWSRSSFVRLRISLHDCSPPAMSIVRGVWRIIGGFRASTFRYAFRTDESIRVSVLMWLIYPARVMSPGICPATGRVTHNVVCLLDVLFIQELLPLTFWRALRRSRELATLGIRSLPSLLSHKLPELRCP